MNLSEKLEVCAASALVQMSCQWVLILPNLRLQPQTHFAMHACRSFISPVRQRQQHVYRQWSKYERAPLHANLRDFLTINFRLRQVCLVTYTTPASPHLIIPYSPNLHSTECHKIKQRGARAIFGAAPCALPPRKGARRRVKQGAGAGRRAVERHRRRVQR